jgi:hypothetical protein
MNFPRAHEPGSAALAAGGTAGRSTPIRFGMHPDEFTARLRGFQKVRYFSREVVHGEPRRRRV